MRRISSDRLARAARWLPVLLLAGALTCGGSVAQEWSAAQKDVWKSVQTYWDLAAKRDLEGFMSYFHDDYSGWNLRSSLPTGKSTVKMWVGHSFLTTREILHTIQPVAIKIHGNVAIVHYYFSMLEQNAKGEEESLRGRWTDVLLKQGDRWVLIADQGGAKSSD